MQRKAKLEEAGENKLEIKTKGYFPTATAFPDDTGSNNWIRYMNSRKGHLT
jgi:hypothetical protein